MTMKRRIACDRCLPLSPWTQKVIRTLCAQTLAIRENAGLYDYWGSA